ncbi:MAG: hypothetical protein WDN23_09475 [Edaphobacter sp.]
MPERRSIFLHGLSLTLRRFPAFLWTYAFNLGLALLFSIPFHRQVSTLLSSSLASQRLTTAFDLGTVAETYLHLHQGPTGDAGMSFGHASIPLFFLIYFLLVPGTLFVYQTNTPARLSTLLHQGLLHFWRFVRITLIALIVCGLILGPLSGLQGRWADYIDEHVVGRNGFLLTLAADIILLLIASILRLYFDLVEVYTVQLGLHRRTGVFGLLPKPDRRVRRTLIPAWRTLRTHFSRLWPIFLLLTVLGIAAVGLTARTMVHMLAQPRVWPTFLLAQLGLFLMLFTRFWQRGVETALALQNPIAETALPPILPISAPVNPIDPIHPSRYPPPPPPIPEPISNPEPAPPSLDEPDPGVFHHDPTKPPQ